MANYVLLEKITVGASGASSVTFSSIPQTGYTDLVVKMSTRGNRASLSDWIYVSFNGSTTGFSARVIESDGGNVSSYSGFPQVFGVSTGTSSTANTFGNSESYIPNYTSSANKSWSTDSVNENNGANAYTTLSAGLWSNTAAITSITLTNRVGTAFDANSAFYLYGVAKLGTTPAIVPYATGGDTIMTDGTYWYHAFLSSGTFTPVKALSCDVLQIAGGGGGNCDDVQFWAGGGGGAGGLLGFTSQSIATARTVTVGAGGTGGLGQGTAGSNSQFGSLTASVGGGSGFFVGVNNGGSGAGITPRFNGTPGTGVAGQGFAGGASSGQNAGSGGGGAGAAGQVQQSNGSNPNGAAGGVGLSTYSSWGAATGTGQNVSGTRWFAGGGGGGGISSYGGTLPSAGGNGGGGNGSPGGVGNGGIAGLANTGGGGGGAGGSSGTGGSLGAGNGGSGIVIVRYLV